MRDGAEGTAWLPWADWARKLPDAARAVMSNVDSAAPYVYVDPPAVANELPGVRAELRRWSKAVQLRAEQTEDVVLAVDEAVANAVEHAYASHGGQPGVVVVFAGRLRSESKVYVVVSDAGHWRPPLADTGFRGRGVSLMKALASHFELYHNENGTTVLLGWNTP